MARPLLIRPKRYRLNNKENLAVMKRSPLKPSRWPGIVTRHARIIALALPLTIGAAGCAGDKVLFPETSYNAVTPAEFELTHPVTLFGSTEIPAGTRILFRNDLFTKRINKMVLGKDATIQGLRIPARSEAVVEAASDHIVVKVVTLGGEASFKDLSFKAKDVVAFNRDGTVSDATLGSDRTFDGKHYPAQTTLWFRDGSVTRSETQAQRDKAADQRKACDANCAGLQGGAWDACHGKCVMM